MGRYCNHGSESRLHVRNLALKRRAVCTGASADRPQLAVAYPVSSLFPARLCLRSVGSLCYAATAQCVTLLAHAGRAACVGPHRRSK